MKKQIVLVSWLISLVTTILFLIISITVVDNYRNKNTRELLNKYLSFSTTFYDGNNYENLNNELRKVNVYLKLTLIDFNGNIIYNSNTYNSFSNHLEREEVKDLGTVYYRKNISNQDTLYIAGKVSSHYLILAMPNPTITSVVRDLVLASIGLFIIITILANFLLDWVNKKAFKPLLKQINNYSNLVDDELIDNYSGISAITNNLNFIYKSITNKLNFISDEKNKLEYVLDTMNQGILVLNEMGKTVLINEYANKLFLNPRDSVTTSFLGKHYLYLIRNVSLQNQIEHTIIQGASSSMDIIIDHKIYLVNITPTEDKWTVTKNGRYGVVLLMLDVTERRNLEKTKRDFFANASHELKSPLTTILGYQQMISEDVISTPEEIEDAVRRTIKEAKRIDKILNEMLDLARIESKFESVIEEINLKNIIHDIIDSFKIEIADKQLNLNLNIEDYIFEMNISHCNQLLNNLIENAIKYNNYGGKLDILLIGNQLHIKDTGIGIAKENQNRIFERFYRVDKGRSKELGGTGLGLAIVKHICQVYSIGIKINSEINKGTDFVLSFPIKK